MKVIELTAENFKKLKAVTIKPEANIQVISGANEQGKSSVIDSIWFALRGAEAAKETRTSMPIRDGQDKGKIKLDLGDIVVTRKFTKAGTTVTVESKDGAVFKSPQAILDNLIGRVALDPLSFANETEAKQKEILLSIVDIGIDLDKNAQDRKAAFDERTLVNREITNMGEIAPVEKAEPVDMGELTKAEKEIRDKLNALYLQNKKTNEEARKKHLAEIEIEREGNKKFNDEQIRISDMLSDINDHLIGLRHYGYKGQEVELWIGSLLQPQPQKTEINIPEPKYIDPELPDDSELRAIQDKLRNAGDINSKAKEYQSYLKKVADKEAKQKDSYAFTKKIEKLDKEKNDAVVAAKFPVAGLSFSDDGVLYNNIPFSQCSSAQKLRVSVAVAMATNPKLRVIRISDGSLLDTKNMAILEEIAKENDFQCWVEKVDESGSMGVCIEDGEVAND
jgi:hypothetical protein